MNTHSLLAGSPQLRRMQNIDCILVCSPTHAHALTDSSAAGADGAPKMKRHSGYVLQQSVKPRASRAGRWANVFAVTDETLRPQRSGIGNMERYASGHTQSIRTANVLCMGYRSFNRIYGQSSGRILKIQ